MFKVHKSISIYLIILLLSSISVISQCKCFVFLHAVFKYVLLSFKQNADWIKDLQQSVFKLVANNLTVDSNSIMIIESIETDLNGCLFECNYQQDCLLIITSSSGLCILLMFVTSFNTATEPTQIYIKQKYIF